MTDEKPDRKLPIDRFLLRAIALDAMVDESTLAKALLGGVMRPLTEERIRRALSARGMLSLLPGAEGSGARPVTRGR